MGYAIGKARRHFTREFKVLVVRMVSDKGVVSVERGGTGGVSHGDRKGILAWANRAIKGQLAAYGELTYTPYV